MHNECQLYKEETPGKCKRCRGLQRSRPSSATGWRHGLHRAPAYRRPLHQEIRQHSLDGGTEQVVLYVVTVPTTATIEAEVPSLVATGLSNRDIAGALSVSERTSAGQCMTRPPETLTSSPVM